MGSLAGCLDRHKISGIEAEVIRKAAKVHREVDKYPAQEANELAVSDILAKARVEYKEMLAALNGLLTEEQRGLVYPDGKEAVTAKEEAPIIAEVPQKEELPEKKVEAPKAIEEKVKERGVIEDFGQKIEGARKDMVAAMRKEYSDDDIASLPLSKIWPADLSDKIEDPYVAAIAFAARAEIPSKPRQPYKVKRWVEQVKVVRSLAEKMLSSTMIRAKAEALLNESVPLKGFAAKVSLLEAIDRNQWGRIGKVSEYPDAYKYGEDKEKIPSPMVNVQIDGSTQTFAGATSVADVVERVNEKLGVEKQAAKMKFEVRGREGAYFINKAGDSEYRHLKEFATGKEALDYRNTNYNDLVAAWEDVKERDNVKQADVRREENRPRTAEDYRKGKDITVEQFSETFGFRGGQFGNWVSQGKNAKERQGMINNAYDALMDLSSILNIPPKAVSLNGELGIAFGARGSGAASAHFESDELVINLTKTRGAGTLAHEWFHSLDNYFQRKRGVTSTGTEGRFVTYLPEALYVHKDRPTGAKLQKAELTRRHERDINNPAYDPKNWQTDPKHPEGIRPEVEARFAELVESLNKSPMSKRSSLIDAGKSDGYWSRIIERAARSFENYIIAKMAEKGYNNDYLANVANINEFKRDMGRYPYLKDEELAPVVEAFDNLFGEIKAKETDKGTMLLSRAVTRPQVWVRQHPQTKEWLAQSGTGEQGRILTKDADLQTVMKKAKALAPDSDIRVLRGGQSLLSREEGAGPGLEVAQVEASINSILKNWKNAPEVITVDSMGSLPDHLQDYIMKSEGEGDIEGLFDPKTKAVYLVAGNISSTNRAVEVLLHESFGHFGLRGMMGESIKPLLNVVWREKNAEAREIAKRYGLKVTAEGVEGYNARQTAAEEVLANMAMEANTPPLLKRVMSAIRNWMRKVGFDIQLTDDDLKKIVYVAAQFVRTGKKPLSLTGMIAYSMREEAKPFYSQLERTIEDKIQSAPDKKIDPDTFKGLLSAAGIKSDELTNTKIKDFLEGKKVVGEKVSKNDALDYLKEQRTELKDVVLGEDVKYQAALNAESQNLMDKPYNDLTGAEQRQIKVIVERDIVPSTQFSSYQEPGSVSGSYREMFVTAPEIGLGGKTAYSPDELRRMYSEKLINREEFDAGLKGRVIDITKNWQDGHHQYADIQNPVIRIRFNEREGLPLEVNSIINKQKIDRARESLQNLVGGKVAFESAFKGVEGVVDIAANHDQVADMVISFIPIDVMNKLKAAKFVSQDFFSGKPVAANDTSLLVNSRADIIAGMRSALEKTGAKMRTEIMRHSLAGLDGEVLPTLRTSDLNRDEVRMILTSELVDRSHVGEQTALLPGTGIGTALPIPLGLGVKIGSADYAKAMRAHEELLKHKQSRNARAKILFIEEIQTPSKENMAKMPEWLQKRAYDIGVKRILKYAADNGFDGVSWTPGGVQADRYDLSKHIDAIGYKKRGELYNVTVWDKEGKQVWQNQSASKEDVENTVGKEMLRKMENEEGEHGDEGVRFLQGLDLKVGGEGLKSLYDKILPKKFQEITKGKVGETRINIPGKEEPVSYTVLDGRGNAQLSTVREERAKQEAERIGGTVQKTGGIEAKKQLSVPFILVPKEAAAGYPLYMRGNKATEGSKFASKIEADRESGDFATEEELKAEGYSEQEEEAYRKLTEEDDNIDMSGHLLAKDKKEIWEDAKKTVDRAIGIISTRLGNIHPRIKAIFREHQRDLAKAISEDHISAHSFIKKFQKLPKKIRIVLSNALLDGRKDDADIIAKRHGLLEETKVARRIFDTTRSRAIEAGLDVGKVDNYWARVVKNPKKLLAAIRGTEAWSGIDAAIRRIEKEKGPLSEIEKSIIIDQVLRGYPANTISLTSTSHLKERKFDQIPNQYLDYYLSADQSLLSYITSMNNTIEAAKFFGKSKKPRYKEFIEGVRKEAGEAAREENRRTGKMSRGDYWDAYNKFVSNAIKEAKLEADINPEIVTEAGLDESIGTLINNLMSKGLLDPAKEQDLRDMAQAVFRPARTGYGVRAYKNLTYLQLLTQFTPAITQIQDIALSAEKAGYWNTLKVVGKVITGKADFTVKDVHVENMMAEIDEGQDKLAKALQWALRNTGFTWMDRIGKETLLNASMLKFQKQAKANDPKLRARVEMIFEEHNPEQVMKDLAAGVKNDDTLFMLFNELSDQQPITVLEVPEKYLTAKGVGKTFYALKTYQLKLFDVYRRDVWNEYRNGDKVEASRKLFFLTAALIVMGVGTDEIKDFILGREADWDDRAWDNGLKLIGLSKYTIYKARKEGVGEALLAQFAPPMGIINPLAKDVDEFLRKGELEKGARSTANVPVAGKMYYWWLGRGAEQKAEDTEKREKQDRIRARLGEAGYKRYQEREEKKALITRLKSERTRALHRADTSEEKRKIIIKYREKLIKARA